MKLKPFSHLASSVVLSLAFTTSYAVDTAEETPVQPPVEPLTLEEQVEQNTQRISTNADDIMTSVYLHHDKQVQIDALDQRIAELENGSVVNSLHIDVDCSTDSINNAITNAPAAGDLIVNVSGNCTETVVITRSNTALVGEGGASIAFAAPATSNPFFPTLNSTISIIGAQNVIIDNLTITGAPGDGSQSNGAGVNVLHGGAALVKDSTLSHNYDGVKLNRAVAKLVGNTIESNIRGGLIVLNSSSVNLGDGNSISQLTNNTIDGRAYGIGAYRNSTVTITGENTITTSTHSPRLDALSIFYGAELRSFFGLLTVNGDSAVGDNSQINFRDVDYNGDIFVGQYGILRLQNRTGQTFSGVSMTGDVLTSTFSTFSAASNTTLEGNVACTSSGLSSVSISPSATFTGTMTPTCGPNYLSNQAGSL